MKVILGLDQGTTGSTALLMNTKGRILASSNQPFRQHFPRPGWVEHHPQDIIKSLGVAVHQALRQAQVKPQQIKAIGITNQRETVSLFRGQKALHPFIVWQDRRTADICKRLAKHQAGVIRKTGTPLDPYFSSTKIYWLKKHLKLSGRAKDIQFRTIDSFLLKELTGYEATECSNAHRTQLMNLKSLQWDSSLFSLFDVPEHWAPPILASEAMALKTKKLPFLPAGIPVQAILGDQQAALFGQSCLAPGEGKITFGTGAFILMNTGDRPIISKNKLVSTVGIQYANGTTHYAMEGSVFICGAWVQWLRDQLLMIQESSEIESLAKSIENSAGVSVVPALSGLGAPFWNATARGAILGLTRGSTRNAIARASLEALAFQNKALLEAMKRDVPRVRAKWKVDGGAVKNNLLMQIQANALGLNIHRPKNLEATAYGVALLAAKAQGYLSLQDIQKLWKVDRVFMPQPKTKTYYAQTYQKWLQHVKNV